MFEFLAFLLPIKLGHPMQSPSALTERVSLNLARTYSLIPVQFVQAPLLNQPPIPIRGTSYVDDPSFLPPSWTHSLNHSDRDLTSFFPALVLLWSALRSLSAVFAKGPFEIATGQFCVAHRTADTSKPRITRKIPSCCLRVQCNVAATG